MTEDIELKFTSEEIRFLASLMMNARFGLLKGLNEDWMPVIAQLSDKFSLAQGKKAAELYKAQSITNKKEER